MVLLSLGALAVGWLAVVLVVIGLCVLAGRTDRPLACPCLRPAPAAPPCGTKHPFRVRRYESHTSGGARAVRRAGIGRWSHDGVRVRKTHPRGLVERRALGPAAAARPAFEGHDVAYVTTDPGYRADVGDARFYVACDANRWNKLALVRCAAKIAWIMLRERPNVVISTGAAAGYFAVRLGQLLGAHTVWVDSVANVEELSLSGRMASTKADLCLTQWPHLADGPVRYEGSVL